MTWRITPVAKPRSVSINRSDTLLRKRTERAPTPAARPAIVAATVPRRTGLMVDMLPIGYGFNRAVYHVNHPLQLGLLDAERGHENDDIADRPYDKALL